MILPHDSPIVQTLSRLLIPAIQLYAVYVIFHAPYSPGGGFVGGVLFGSSLILTVLVFGTSHSRGFIEKMTRHGDGLGLMLFAGIGVLCVLAGREFLNYAGLLLPGMETASKRHFGIMVTQLGVAMDVAVVAISIFLHLSPQEEGHTTDA